MPSFFVIWQESPQQPPDMLQQEAFLSLSPPGGFAFCANETPAIAIVSPSTRQGANLRKQFIFISPVKKNYCRHQIKLMLSPAA
jgi:hypothetical protein